MTIDTTSYPSMQVIATPIEEQKPFVPFAKLSWITRQTGDNSGGNINIFNDYTATSIIQEYYLFVTSLHMTSNDSNAQLLWFSINTDSWPEYITPTTPSGTDITLWHGNIAAGDYTIAPDKTIKNLYLGKFNNLGRIQTSFGTNTDTKLYTIILKALLFQKAPRIPSIYMPTW